MVIPSLRKMLLRLVRAPLLWGGLVSVALLIFVAQKGTFLNVQSGSMEPELSRGDVLIAQKATPSELQIGDIISFKNPRNNKEVLTHRIVGTPKELGSNNFQTKGDANVTPDPYISSDAIIGKVHYAVPFVGYAVDQFRRPSVVMIAIYAVALLAIGLYARRKYIAANRKCTDTKTGWHRMRARYMVFALLLPLFLAHSVRNVFATNVAGAASIASVPLTSHGEVVRLASIVLPCGAASASVRPEVVLHNTSKHTVDLNDWQLLSSSGVMTRLANKSLRAGQMTTIRLELTDGIRYEGEHVVLLNANSQVVDNISWGDDVSAFSPAVQPLIAGSAVARAASLDTDTAADWQVSAVVCK